MRPNGSSKGKPSARAPISPQVAALRRRVWTVRILFFAVVAVSLWGYNQILSLRSASLRKPEVALATTGQAFSDAGAWLKTHGGQLILQATATEYRGVKLGPLSPAGANVQSTAGRWYLRVSNVSISESGEPVVSPVQFVTVSHQLDGRGLVAEITLEATYSVCWDRAAKSPRQLTPGEELPRPSTGEVIQGVGTRYSEGLDVVDRLVLRMDHRALRWEPSEVERVRRTVRR